MPIFTWEVEARQWEFMVIFCYKASWKPAWTTETLTQRNKLTNEYNTNSDAGVWNRLSV